MMTFIDTNYFLRFLLKDNEAQFKEAEKLLLAGAEGRERLLTSLLVLFEIYWVLSSYYRQNKKSVTLMLRNILALDFILLPGKETLSQALDLYEKLPLDLEDAYNLAYSLEQKAGAFKTFDAKLAKTFLKHHATKR